MAREGYVQVCMTLRTECVLLRLLWLFFISFHFGDDNISLDIKSYEIRVFLLSGDAYMIFLQSLCDKGVCKYRNISLYMILFIEHLEKKNHKISFHTRSSYIINGTGYFVEI